MGNAADRPKRYRRRRAARTATLTALGTFVVLNLGLAAAMQLWPGLRDPMFSLPARHFAQRIEADDDRAITIAFLGSSRTGWGVRPVVAEDAVTAATGRPCVAHNLHVPGNGPVGQLVHWHRLLDRGVLPTVVVIEITLPRMAAPNGVPDEHESFRGDRMTRPETELVRAYGFPASVEADWRDATFNPWFGLRFQALGTLRPKWLPPGVARHEPKPAADLGWNMPFFVYHNAEQFPQAVEMNRPLIYKQMQTVTFDGPTARALKDLVRSCRDHGVKPVVFVTPEASLIRQWATADVNRALAEYLMELRGLGATVVDGREWLPDEAFSDGHHAVRSWADDYTRQLVGEAVVPALLRQE